MTSCGCRLCGAADFSTDCAIDVHSENNDAVSLEFIIRTRLQITITKGDRFSPTICLQCAQKLHQIYVFTKECQQNQLRLFAVADADETFKQFQGVENVDVDGEWCDGEGARHPKVEWPRVPDSADDVAEVKFESPQIKITAENCDNIIIPELVVTAENCDNIVIPELIVPSPILDREIQAEPEYNTDNIISERQEKIPLSKIVDFLSTKIKRKSESPVFKSTSRGNCTTDECDLWEIQERYGTLDGFTSDDSVCDKKRKYRVRKNQRYRGPNDVTCPYCGWIFSRHELEDNHIHLHTDDSEFHRLLMEFISKKSNCDTPTLECPDCHEIFNRDITYIEHQNEHLRRKPLKCHVCDHSFSSRKRLKCHMCSVHLERNFKCDECSYRAKNAADIDKHRTGVHSGQRIMCPLCGKLIAAYPHNLKKHMETHSEVPSYQCEVCPMAYRTNASLQKHRENKHFPIPVMCSICGSMSASKQKYKKHISKCKKRNAVEK